jgi:hypothetical protein
MESLSQTPAPPVLMEIKQMGRPGDPIVAAAIASRQSKAAADETLIRPYLCCVFHCA